MIEEIAQIITDAMRGSSHREPPAMAAARAVIEAYNKRLLRQDVVRAGALAAATFELEPCFREAAVAEFNNGDETNYTGEAYAVIKAAIEKAGGKSDAHNIFRRRAAVRGSSKTI
jgi:hypothetical protein